MKRFFIFLLIFTLMDLKALELKIKNNKKNIDSVKLTFWKEVSIKEDDESIPEYVLGSFTVKLEGKQNVSIDQVPLNEEALYITFEIISKDGTNIPLVNKTETIEDLDIIAIPDIVRIEIGEKTAEVKSIFKNETRKYALSNKDFIRKRIKLN